MDTSSDGIFLARNLSIESIPSASATSVPENKPAISGTSSLRSVGGLSMLQDPTAAGTMAGDVELTYSMYELNTQQSVTNGAVTSAPDTSHSLPSNHSKSTSPQDISTVTETPHKNAKPKKKRSFLKQIKQGQYLLSRNSDSSGLPFQVEDDNKNVVLKSTKGNIGPAAGRTPSRTKRPGIPLTGNVAKLVYTQNNGEDTSATHTAQINTTHITTYVTPTPPSLKASTNTKPIAKHTVGTAVTAKKGGFSVKSSDSSNLVSHNIKAGTGHTEIRRTLEDTLSRKVQPAKEVDIADKNQNKNGVHSYSNGVNSSLGVISSHTHSGDSVEVNADLSVAMESADAAQVPAVTAQSPAANELAPAVTDKAPPNKDQTPAVTDKAPPNKDQTPAVSDETDKVSAVTDNISAVLVTGTTNTGSSLSSLNSNESSRERGTVVTQTVMDTGQSRVSSISSTLHQSQSMTSTSAPVTLASSTSSVTEQKGSWTIGDNGDASSISSVNVQRQDATDKAAENISSSLPTLTQTTSQNETTSSTLTLKKDMVKSASTTAVAEVPQGAVSNVMKNKQFQNQMNSLFGGRPVDSMTSAPTSLQRRTKKKLEKADKEVSGAEETISSTPRLRSSRSVPYDFESQTFPRRVDSSNTERVSSFPTSPLEELRSTVKEGTVNSLVRDKFKNLRLTGGLMGASAKQSKKSTSPSEEGSQTAPSETTRRFKFVVEGIDVPAVEEPATSVPLPDAGAGAGAAVPKDDSPKDDENDVTKNPATLKKLKKDGFSYILDKKLAGEIIKKAATVSASRPHETVEVKQPQVVKTNEDAVLVETKAKLVKNNSFEEKVTSPPGFVPMSSSLLAARSKLSRVEASSRVMYDERPVLSIEEEGVNISEATSSHKDNDVDGSSTTIRGGQKEVTIPIVNVPLKAKEVKVSEATTSQGGKEITVSEMTTGHRDKEVIVSEAITSHRDKEVTVSEATTTHRGSKKKTSSNKQTKSSDLNHANSSGKTLIITKDKETKQVIKETKVIHEEQYISSIQRNFAEETRAKEEDAPPLSDAVLKNLKSESTSQDEPPPAIAPSVNNLRQHYEAKKVGENNVNAAFPVRGGEAERGVTSNHAESFSSIVQGHTRVSTESESTSSSVSSDDDEGEGVVVTETSGRKTAHSQSQGRSQVREEEVRGAKTEVHAHTYMEPQSPVTQAHYIPHEMNDQGYTDRGGALDRKYTDRAREEWSLDRKYEDNFGDGNSLDRKYEDNFREGRSLDRKYKENLKEGRSLDRKYREHRITVGSLERKRRARSQERRERNERERARSLERKKRFERERARSLERKERYERAMSLERNERFERERTRSLERKQRSGRERERLRERKTRGGRERARSLDWKHRDNREMVLSNERKQEDRWMREGSLEQNHKNSSAELGYMRERVSRGHYDGQPLKIHIGQDHTDQGNTSRSRQESVTSSVSLSVDETLSTLSSYSLPHRPRHPPRYHLTRSTMLTSQPPPSVTISLDNPHESTSSTEAHSVHLGHEASSPSHTSESGWREPEQNRVSSLAFKHPHQLTTFDELARPSSHLSGLTSGSLHENIHEDYHPATMPAAMRASGRSYPAEVPLSPVSLPRSTSGIRYLRVDESRTGKVPRYGSQDTSLKRTERVEPVFVDTELQKGSSAKYQVRKAMDRRGLIGVQSYDPHPDALRRDKRSYNIPPRHLSLGSNGSDDLRSPPAVDARIQKIDKKGKNYQVTLKLNAKTPSVAESVHSDMEERFDTSRYRTYPPPHLRARHTQDVTIETNPQKQHARAYQTHQPAPLSVAPHVSHILTFEQTHGDNVLPNNQMLLQTSENQSISRNRTQKLVSPEPQVQGQIKLDHTENYIIKSVQKSSPQQPSSVELSLPRQASTGMGLDTVDLNVNRRDTSVNRSMHDGGRFVTGTVQQSSSSLTRDIASGVSTHHTSQQAGGRDTDEPRYTMYVNQTMTMDYAPPNEPEPRQHPTTSSTSTRTDHVVSEKQRRPRHIRHDVERTTTRTKLRTDIPSKPAPTRRRSVTPERRMPARPRSPSVSSTASSASYTSSYSDDDSADMRVVRGSILIKNRMESVSGGPKVIDFVRGEDSDDDEFTVEGNTNLFDRGYFQPRENPIYSSQEDLSTTQHTVHHRPSFTQIFDETDASRVNGLDRRSRETDVKVTRENSGDQDRRRKKTRSGDVEQGENEWGDSWEETRKVQTVETREERDGGRRGGGRRSSSSAQFDINKLLMGAPPDSIKQTINVEKEEEEVMGPLSNHATGSRSREGLLDFDTVSEKVDLGMEDGKAQVAVKVRCERVVPIRGVDDMFKKSSVIVTRLIEIDLMVTEERRRLYEHITNSSSKSNSSRHAASKLNNKETFKLYKTFMGLAEAGEAAQKDVQIDREVEENRHRPYMGPADNIVDDERGDFDVGHRQHVSSSRSRHRVQEADAISYNSVTSGADSILY